MPAALLAQPERALCSCLPGWDSNPQGRCHPVIAQQLSCGLLDYIMSSRSEGINGSKAQSVTGSTVACSRCQGPPGLCPRCSGRKAGLLSIWKSRRRNRAGTLPTGSEWNGHRSWDGPAGPSLWSLAIIASTVSAGLASSSFTAKDYIHPR